MRMVVVKMSQVNQTDLPPGRARMQQQKGPCVLSAMENFFYIKGNAQLSSQTLTPLGRITPQTFHGKMISFIRFSIKHGVTVQHMYC